MTNQQGAPEALFYADALGRCAEVDFDHIFVPAAAVIRRLHAENERLASLVDAQQPTQSAAAVVPLDAALHAVAYLGMHNSASRETEMVQMLRKAARAPADNVPDGKAHGWVTMWPSPAGGYEPIYSPGECKPRYGTELDAVLSVYPVFLSADSVLEDAARYRWLRQEHERVDPVCHLTWKRNLQRDSSEWVNTAVLDTAIDKARKQGASHD